MSDAFGPPLSVEISADIYRRVASVRDAVEILTRHWVGAPRGFSRIAAMQACLDALKGKGSAAAVRRSFLDAAEEAGFFVRDWP
jgi:hypothetical protein